MDIYCQIHEGGSNDKHVEAMMEGLLKNQGGKGRHKCPYCAYERGFEAGIRHAAASLQDMVLKESAVIVS